LGGQTMWELVTSGIGQGIGEHIGFAFLETTGGDFCDYQYRSRLMR
jgi:hypothetical protein